MLPKISYPTFDVILPSSQNKIKIRPMLVKEEKILLMAKEGSEDSEIFNSIRQIVNACILDDNINVNKLTIFDIEFIFLKNQFHPNFSRALVDYSVHRVRDL